MRAAHLVAAVLIAYTMAGCSGSPVAGPSPGVTTTPAPRTRQPLISTIVPDTGSIYGGGEVRIFGNFERSAIATIGGIRTVQGWSPTDPTVRILHAPPHAAGPVDVIVTNPDGRSQTVVGGYTYVEPESFDLNGEWDAVTVDGSDTFLQFTVRARVLTRVRCENSFYQTVEMTLSVPVLNGRAEFSGDAGNFSAWVASASQAAGTIDMPPCSGGLRWQAARTRP